MEEYRTRSSSIFVPVVPNQEVDQRSPRSFQKKIYMLEHHTRPTKLEWVGGGVMNLENLPSESVVDSGLKTNDLGLRSLNFCVNPNDLKVLARPRFLGPTAKASDSFV